MELILLKILSLVIKYYYKTQYCLKFLKFFKEFKKITAGTKLLPFENGLHLLSVIGVHNLPKGGK